MNDGYDKMDCKPAIDRQNKGRGSVALAKELAKKIIDEAGQKTSRGRLEDTNHESRLTSSSTASDASTTTGRAISLPSATLPPRNGSPSNLSSRRLTGSTSFSLSPSSSFESFQSIASNDSSSSRASDARIIHAGFLRKQSPRGIKPFQQRYFQLMSNGRLEYYKFEKRNIEVSKTNSEELIVGAREGLMSTLSGTGKVVMTDDANKSNRSITSTSTHVTESIMDESHPVGQHPLGVIMLDAIEDISLRKHRGTSLGVNVSKPGGSGSATKSNGGPGAGKGGPILLELVAYKTGRDKLKKYTLMAETIQEGSKWLKILNSERYKVSIIAASVSGRDRVASTRTVHLTFKLPDGSIHALEVEPHIECGAILRKLFAQIQDSGTSSVFGGLSEEADDYDLVIKRLGESSSEEDIFTSCGGEGCTLSSYSRVHRAMTMRTPLKCEVVSMTNSFRMQQEQARRREALQDIKQLIGASLPAYRMSSFRCNCPYAILGVSEMAGKIPNGAEVLGELLEKFKLKNVKASCTFQECDMNLTLPFNPSDKVVSFRDKLFTTYQVATDSTEPNTAFTLRIANCHIYLDTSPSSDTVMGDLQVVHDAVHLKKHIHLELVRRLEAPTEEALIDGEDIDHLSNDSSPRGQDVDSYANRNKSIDFDKMGSISLFDLGIEYRIRVLEVSGLRDFLESYDNWKGDTSMTLHSLNQYHCFVEAALYHGFETLSTRSAPVLTTLMPASNSIRCGEWLHLGVRLSDMPRGCSVRFTVYLCTHDKRTKSSLCWVNFIPFDEDGLLKTGFKVTSTWPQGDIGGRNVPLTCPIENSGKLYIKKKQVKTPKLYIEVESFQLPVRHPGFTLSHITCDGNGEGNDRSDSQTADRSVQEHFYGTERSDLDIDIEDKAVKAVIQKCVFADPLSVLGHTERALLWQHRNCLPSISIALPKVLRAVRWAERHTVYDMYRLLDEWAPLGAHNALELLGNFVDPVVREYAVKRLHLLSDPDLDDVLLQLTQALKLEPYHDSPLARFLLITALRNPDIGHSLFWHLRSELHCPDSRERYAIILQEYLLRCGLFRQDLLKQIDVERKCSFVATAVKEASGKEERMAILRRKLEDMELPSTMRIPLSLKKEVCRIKVDKCKFMDSKKLPLWLVFESANHVADDLYIIFKSGDDLRQDQVTLQMLRLMDNLWKANGLDLRMRPYRCITTGDEVGMIEVVLNSETTSGISMAAGGGFACFKEEPLANWLRDNNPKDEEYVTAVDNFTRSCAGYCVATCVLGIGDRHNDNIMVTRDGCLFHIDFGHFLGNFKSKFGFKRERAKFVLTPDFAYVMGGKGSEGFKRFEALCVKAFNLLRKEAALFLNLFALMLSSGIPELRTVDDISYLRESFLLDMSDEDAGKEFVGWIHECLSCKMTQINNAIHTFVHG